MTTAAPAGVAPAPESGPEGGQEGGTNGQPAPPTPRKLKLKGIDGPDVEREYDEAELVGLAQRGKQTARILSKAEERAQAAAKKEAEYEAKISRLKGADAKAQRAALREMGVDVRKLAEAEVEEYFSERELTPEQKRIRELEAKEKERQAKDSEAKTKAEQEALETEEAHHRDELSALFLDVMELARLPKSSSRAAFARIAPLYQAAQSTGVEISPEVAAERVKGALRAEQKALFYKEGLDAKGQKTQVLDLDAMEEWFSPEEWTAINRRAVEKFRARRTSAAAPSPVKPQATQEQMQAGDKSTPGRKNFWKEVDKRFK